MEDKKLCKECLKYVPNVEMKGDVCYKCYIALKMRLERLERKGYLKTK
jgi:hypothetical protein